MVTKTAYRIAKCNSDFEIEINSDGEMKVEFDGIKDNPISESFSRDDVEKMYQVLKKIFEE